MACSRPALMYVRTGLPPVRPALRVLSDGRRRAPVTGASAQTPRVRFCSTAPAETAGTATPATPLTSGWHGTIGNAPGGGNAVAVDADVSYAQSLSQTVLGLTPGSVYSLSFFQAAGQQKGQSGATTEQWQVTLGSDTQTSALMQNASQGNVGWNVQVLTFTATATSEVLKFLALGTPNGQPPVGPVVECESHFGTRTDLAIDRRPWPRRPCRRPSPALGRPLSTAEDRVGRVVLRHRLAVAAR